MYGLLLFVFRLCLILLNTLCSLSKYIFISVLFGQCSGLANRLGSSRFAVRHYTNMGPSHGHGSFPWSRAGQNNHGASGTNTVRLRARGLLDHESLACLLVLLFLDESRLNMSRLHRILRNLCYHGPTRSWLLEALLSVLQRTGECYVQSDDRLALRSGTEQSSSTPAATSTPQKTGSADSKVLAQPSWLSASLDAALGCRTNVFQLQRGSGKKHSNVSSIGIHPHAAGLVYRHVLDTLISLAKSFPAQFLPVQYRTSTVSESEKDDGSKIKDDHDDLGDEGSKDGAKAEGSARHDSEPGKAKEHHADASRHEETDFWNLLVRLDSSTYGRKGKGTQRVHFSGSGSSGMITEEDRMAGESALAQLMVMLQHPIVRRSQMLTDRLLRLLGLVTVGLGDPTKAAGSTAGATAGRSARAPLAQDEISPEGMVVYFCCLHRKFDFIHKILMINRLF